MGDPIEIAQLLTDRYAAKILIATSRRAKSAIEISEQFGIPLAQCYRRIHDLEKAGLIKAVDRVLTREGKRIYLYKALVKSVQIYYEGTKMKVRLKLVDAPEEVEEAIELVEQKAPEHEEEKRFSVFMMKAKEEGEENGGEGENS